MDFLDSKSLAKGGREVSTAWFSKRPHGRKRHGEDMRYALAEASAVARHKAELW